MADALGALAEGTRMVIAGEVAQVLAIAAACDLHHVDETVLVEGAERWLPGGADGTPDIGEFVAAELAVVLGVSPQAAVCRIASVLNVRHRHPALWQAVCAGEVRFFEAARVADACVTAGLDQAACLVVDRHCAVALRMQPWARVRGQVDRWILLADPQAAAEREARAGGVRRVEVGQIRDGHVDLWGRLDAGDGLAFDDALTTIAKSLDTDTTFDVRRAAAVGILARQALGQQELPRAADLVVRVDATATPDGGLVLDEAATVARWGAVLTDRLGSLLTGCRVTVRPVIDAQRLTATDAYQLPDSMRRVLHERWGVDAFPFGTKAAAGCQSDHTIPYDHEGAEGAGQTHPDLMAPLSSFAHRVKTHGGWGCEQPVPGLLVWTTPHGWQLAVTPAGTIRIGRPEPPEHAWWQQEPPEWLEPDPPSPRGVPPALVSVGADRRGAEQPADPGEAQPALALDYWLTA